MALYGGEAWGMRSAGRRRVNVLEMKCLRGFVGVLRMDRVRNEEVHRRMGIERELASRADLRVLTWFFRTALHCSGGYHMESGGMPLHDAVGINCKKGATTENQGSAVKHMG